MYVGYLLDKESAMYPNPGTRHPGLSLSPQGYVPAPPQYPDFTSYHHHHHHLTGIGSEQHHGQGPAAWGAPYAPTRDEWNGYGPPGPAQAAPANPAQMGFSSADFNPVPPPGQGMLQPALGSAGPQLSPNSQRRNPYEWMRRGGVPGSTGTASGKTRTKDKYRVVYTDHQRLELEKEFHYSRYITIRRKAELAANLGLTERQVKIWFQNRRAKERKVNKKKMQQQSQPASTTTPTPPMVGSSGGGMGNICSSSGTLLSPSPLTIKEEFMA
ncbi:homeobox protein CDX-1 isoform X2 [Lissotriton helveticus]